MTADRDPIDVPDDVAVCVPTGGRVLVLGELLLRREADAASASAAADAAAAIDACSGPGAVVLAGNTFDLLTDARTTPALSLGAHPLLAAALRRYGGGSDHRIVVLPGDHDARLASEPALQRELAQAFAGELALAASLTVNTGEGDERVRVEPRMRFDERFRSDVRNPADSPLGVHLVREVFPAIERPWSVGLERLSDVSSVPEFAASRFLYRRLLPWSWVLLAPFALALFVKIPLSFVLASRIDRALGPWTHRLQLLAVATAVDVVVVGLIVAAVLSRGWRKAVGGAAFGVDRNAAARDHARRLVGDGVRGLVVGGGETELADLHDGVFVATGRFGASFERRRGRLGLPAVFVPVQTLSWVEIEAGASLHVRLWYGGNDLPGASVIERLVASSGVDRSDRPAVVAAFPRGASWPEIASAFVRLRRIRRRAASAIALAGALDLVSAVTPPLEARLRAVIDVVPLAVPQVATAVTALAGIALLGLARGVRRGQRRAFRVAVALLAGSVALHLVKGVDVEEAAAAAAVAAYLVARRDAFSARAREDERLRRPALLLAGLVVAATVVIEVTTARRDGRVPLGHAIVAVLERLAGLGTVGLPRRVDQFASPALFATGIAFAVWLLWAWLRPAGSRRTATEDRDRARELVVRWGAGTLDYFSLRDDKEYFFTGETVVSYAVRNGVCLVSPDPVGPARERDVAWEAFRRFADEHAWIVAVLGAGEERLPVYRRAGMRELYVGDEAVVDVAHFSLDGGRHKSLRQAVNRVAKYGYTVSFHDPSHVEPDLEEAVRAVLTKGRRGDVERGYSMTLGRIFDAADRGLLLAVCHGPDGRPVAFCQYTPAPGIGGFSLDLMRRDEGEHPNGLLDFVVVETIRHLRESGSRSLGLNFATMRAVLAGETGAGMATSVERWALRRMSSSMQIESLWRFNAKFDPAWQPRYVVYDAPEHVVAVALAVARAESFWELPVIGRFLQPAGSRG